MLLIHLLLQYFVYIIISFVKLTFTQDMVFILVLFCEYYTSVVLNELLILRLVTAVSLIWRFH